MRRKRTAALLLVAFAGAISLTGCERGSEAGKKEAQETVSQSSAAQSSAENSSIAQNSAAQSSAENSSIAQNSAAQISTEKNTDNESEKEETEMSESKEKKSFAIENALDFIGLKLEDAFALAGLTADDFEDEGEGAYEALEAPEIYDGLVSLLQLCDNMGHGYVDCVHYEFGDMDERKAKLVGDGIRSVANKLESLYGEGEANKDWKANIESLPYDGFSQMMIEYNYKKDGVPYYYQIDVITGSSYIIDIGQGEAFDKE